MTTPNPYRAAYEAALKEISEITAMFEQLRVHKGRVEHLITVLQEYLTPTASIEQRSVSPEAQAVETMEATSEAESESAYSYLDVPNPLPDGDGDPFQRRVKTTFRFKGLATQRSF